MRATPPQLPGYRWFPRDFASSTRGWPLAARGVYRELLDAQWDLGALPANPDDLRKLAGAKASEWRVAWDYVASKFPLLDGRRRNPRMETHRASALAQYEARRDAAANTNRQLGRGHHAVR